MHKQGASLGVLQLVKHHSDLLLCRLFLPVVFYFSPTVSSGAMSELLAYLTHPVFRKTIQESQERNQMQRLLIDVLDSTLTLRPLHQRWARCTFTLARYS